MKEYVEVKITASSASATEILIAELAEAGFESFADEGKNLLAYIPKENFTESIITEIQSRYSGIFSFSFEDRVIEPENWNSEWEKNFQPIAVGDKIRVRAQFHPSEPRFPIEITIDPKMAFGTGHHATTWLMMKLLSENNLLDKKVLDYGTGTGILAILAFKCGAKKVQAIDNDPQCILNAEENIALNDSASISLEEGTIESVSDKDFDIILGNITRNIIVETSADIASRLVKNGLFLASGFYEHDLPVVSASLYRHGLILKNSELKDGWCAAAYIKQ